ncbi:hypothetical protein [Mycolicibacterium elephantis]|uniref:hypothetical protein n=1 Tax=Mycolicibacterium elephantis TaxID=81858 RepID=UPI001056DB3C|nr:hypothetical protein [Mycolicibacterium elephantis]
MTVELTPEKLQELWPEIKTSVEKLEALGKQLEASDRELAARATAAAEQHNAKVDEVLREINEELEDE